MADFVKKIFGQLLIEVSEKFPENKAFRCIDKDDNLTFAQMNSQCEILARGLMALGLERKNHLSIWAPNIPEWILAFNACQKLGAITIGVNTFYKEQELTYQLKHSDTKILVMAGGVATKSFVDIINNICPTLKDSDPTNLQLPEFPHLKSIIYIGENCPAGMIPWNSLYTLAEQVPQEELDLSFKAISSDDVALFFYTSGTTGLPKAAMITHYDIINNGYSAERLSKVTSDEHLCVMPPFFHNFGLSAGILLPIIAGCTACLMEIYSPKAALETMHQFKCSAAFGTPTMYSAMLAHPNFDDYSFENGRWGLVAGSICPSKLMKDIIEKLHLPQMANIYGQSEASPVCIMTKLEDTFEHQTSSVGIPMPGWECKVISPQTGEILPPNTPGELCIRGFTMKGYYKQPEATENAIDTEKWYHTKDLAKYDNDGYYYILGRLDDMIIRGGENINPIEIEELLNKQPQILNTVVIGVPSQKYGEEVLACVVLKPDEHITQQEVKDYCSANLASYKVPEYFLFLEQFPLSGSGKVEKNILRKQAVAALKL